MIRNLKNGACAIGFVMLLAPVAGSAAMRPSQAEQLTCSNTNAYCSAATLADLYSRGAEISNSICTHSDPACEREKNAKLLEARNDYLTYVQRLRANRADPAFKGTFGDKDGPVAFSALTAFVDRTLQKLSVPCKLDARVCVRGRVYLLSDLDQAVRNNPSCRSTPSQETACIAKKRLLISRVDTVSRRQVRDILKTHGWLATSDWGRATEDGFFLLVQHADSDTALQKSALETLRSRSRSASSLIHLAYLEDRVRMHARQPQLYGTQGQCHVENGRVIWRADPIHEPGLVDQRRADQGMSSLAQYAQEARAACEQF